MTGTPRLPAFLKGLDAPEVAVRPAPFAAVAPGKAKVRTVLTPPRGPAKPPGASPEQLAALRAEAMQKVAQALETLRSEAVRLAEQARADALELGFLVARRVLEAELRAGPEAFQALVRSALERAGDSRKVVVRVHPDDAPALGPALASVGQGLSAAAVEVAVDPALSPGDCVVVTDFGKVDGRLSTRLEELHQAGLAAVEEGEA